MMIQFPTVVIPHPDIHRPPKLSATQLSRLYGLIVGRDPRQLQFDFALWTREMVRQLIRREFGTSLSVASVGRLLRTLGLSPQRPLHRAYQQDPEKVARWKNEDYPAIRKAAAGEGATIYFADEAGIRSDYHSGTIWAPIGQTPVVESTGARYSVNMLSAVDPARRMAQQQHFGRALLGSVFAGVSVQSGDGFTRPSAGGGGYGDPLDRDPEVVVDDVIDGYVSVARANETTVS